MNLTEYRTELKLDLKDATTLWSNDELDRCVERAVADLSRFIPLEAIYEYTIDYTVTAESSTAPAAATWKDLAHKPIKPESETVTTDPVGTTYTRDTDYTMDYINGKYTIIATGSITEADSLLFGYTKSRLGIDISAIISALIRVVKVEYPVDKVPQQFVSFNIWNEFMYIGSQKVGESQIQLTDKEHIAIYYDKEHTFPTVSADGSYQEYLDQVICIGAGAYALLIKAIQYEHQSVTDLASSRTALGNLSGIHTAVGTALGNLAAIHVLTDAALDKIATYATDADTALDAFITAIAFAPTALAKVDTYLAGASESTKALLAQIATDAASLRTAMITAVVAAKAYLDEVDTTDLVGAEGVWADEVKHILDYVLVRGSTTGTFVAEEEATGGTSSAVAIVKVVGTNYITFQMKVGSFSTDETITGAGAATITATEIETNPTAEEFLELGDSTIDITSILTDVETALDKIATEVAAGKTYIETGDDKINTVNVGDNVPELYRDYANVEVGLGAGYRQEASERLRKATLQQQQAELYRRYAEAALEMARLWENKRRDFLSQATARINAAMGYVQEAESRLSNLRSYIEQGNAYATIANGFTAEADGRTAVARSYVEEAAQRLAMSRGYAEEASGRMAEIDRYLSEVGARLSELDDYVAEADRYIGLAGSDRELADRFKAEGIERRNEFWSILRDKSEYRKRLVSTPVRQ